MRVLGAECDSAPSGRTLAERPRNGFAGGGCLQNAVGLTEITAEAAGSPDARTGYVVSVADLDRWVRDAWAIVAPRAIDTGLPDLLRDLSAALERRRTSHPGIAATSATRLRLRVTPFLAVESTMPIGHAVVILRDFEFSASHRLALPELGAAENLALFGKCSNPNGHGHNYRLRVAVSTEGDPAALGVDLDGLVEEEVLRHMDHKHLNEDTPYFRDRLPSVENIASTIHGLLEGPLSRTPLRLVGVRVWETDRTSAATCAGL